MPARRFLLAGMVLLLSAPATMAQGTGGPAEPPGKRILVVPPLQWDTGAGTFRTAWRQTVTDFANLTGGIIFGLKPAEVSALLPEPMPAVSWSALTLAPEFPEDVRYFWVKVGGGGVLDAGIQSCVGAASYLVFLFRSRGLFRMSYRLIPDSACPSVAEAASAVMARYVTIDPSLALALHYRNGNAEVVDIVDPASGHVGTIRWQQRRR